MNEYTIQTDSISQTHSLGVRLGQQLRGGALVDLVSDLGGGKTTLAGGIVAGIGSHDPVSSPSFTICNTYTIPDGTVIYHFDFYRLDQPGIIANELQEALLDTDAIVIVEWGNIVSSLLPDRKTSITITAQSETARDITIVSPSPLKLESV